MLLPILLLIYIRTSIVIHGGELVQGVEDQAVLPDHDGSHQGTHGQHIVCLNCDILDKDHALTNPKRMNMVLEIFAPKTYYDSYLVP